jgi:hypothetical protein
MATFKELVDSKGGVIEPIRIKEGLVIVITVKNPDQIKSVQEAADRCFADLHKLKKEDIDSSRVKIYEDIKQNKITEQVEKTSTGLLILYTSQDSNCVAEVRAQDTCDWCVCKSQDTSNGCKACCP